MLWGYAEPDPESFSMPFPTSVEYTSTTPGNQAKSMSAVDFSKPLLPTDARGNDRVDDRRVISGNLHVLKSGCRWCDGPPEHGLPTTKLLQESGLSTIKVR
jgi:hypothetical protein